MRWQFVYDQNDKDYKVKQEKIAQIECFWNEFSSVERKFREKFKEKETVNQLTEFIFQYLKPINECLMWELEKLSEDKYLLVITAEDNIELRSLVDEIISSAPILEHWSFSAYRLPEKPHLYSSAYEARTASKLSNDIKLSITKSSTHQIDLNFVSSNFSGDNDVDDIVNCMTLSSIVLGEERYEKWVNSVTTNKQSGSPISFLKGIFAKEPSSDFVSIDGFSEQFDKLHQELKGMRSSETFAQKFKWDDGPIAVIGLDPKKHTDRENLPERITYLTPLPDLILLLSKKERFFSELVSSCDEIFCYMKSDNYGEEGDFEVRLESLESEIDAALRSENIGCVVGTGRGFEHFYVDFALTNLEKAVPLIQEVGVKHGISKNCWLYFYDYHWKDEWIEVYSNSESPGS